MSVTFLSCISITFWSFSWCDDNDGGDNSNVRLFEVGMGAGLVGSVKSSDRSIFTAGAISAMIGLYEYVCTQ